MFHIVLFEPEIPANTGNIIRLCANTGVQLHLIKPLGFDLDDKKLRRAGLDYHEWVAVKEHDSLAEFVDRVKPGRIFALTTKGTKIYSEVSFQAEDALLFGPETRGLPADVLADLGVERCLYLPMQAESRSLNLSNTVSIVLYEAWRQLGFAGAAIK
ncbi:MAG: tRNA (uridine(34)/cytosine(34)/5-carboxymethylaminomethyluridine(34)-2'-O)-methyltransferase TrmL [Methylobacter sp.]|uniref:tRNA (cytidine(34)-2'-O)-methyltransferase n=1 Tax=Candidatus Methylobacter titanis TaxID=3053457 RepID=A0AA43TIT3_9GAMM|nr:tRNA (uridine(34)/cytosine(34)/5-carboxymethylaminomethyluridine(34)-2'-O)-methyltransferase TrmL [Candidatus Methylobacter titanis]MDI1291480.1 tRNA (uridine(34)/cytosine(34)/5-carboxymethylaminomethyluridine(34)-2'-O)-methyltransferase TrmL [Candidatus Methylobacter titanis]